MATMVIYRMNDVPEMPPEGLSEYEQWLRDTAPDDDTDYMLDAYERERYGAEQSDEYEWEEA